MEDVASECGHPSFSAVQIPSIILPHMTTTSRQPEDVDFTEEERKTIAQLDEDGLELEDLREDLDYDNLLRSGELKVKDDARISLRCYLVQRFQSDTRIIHEFGNWLVTTPILRKLKSRERPSETMRKRFKFFKENNCLNTKRAANSLEKILHHSTSLGSGRCIYVVRQLFVLLQDLEDDYARRVREKEQTDIITEEQTRRMINISRFHWLQPYVGDTWAVLLERLLHWADNDSVYSKFIPVTNSSGMGKSKCVDELGKNGPMVISVVLRSGADSGYPPGDPEVYAFFEKINECETVSQANVLAYAFVEGFFLAVSDWANEKKFTHVPEDSSSELSIGGNASGEIKEPTETNLPSYMLPISAPGLVAPVAAYKIRRRSNGFDFKTLTTSWNEDMAPVMASPLGKRRGEVEMASVVARTRSPAKREFISNALRHAERCLEELRDPRIKWDPDFTDFTKEPVMKNRFARLGEVLECLAPANPAIRIPTEFLVLAIDEAGALFDRPLANATVDGLSSPGILYYNILRIFSGMKHMSAWCIPLSTNSNITNLVPPELQDPSTRIQLKNVCRVPPFTSFPMDVVMRENLRRSMKIELSKSLLDYSKIGHIKTMGRILWDRFEITTSQSGISITNNYVLAKLLCAQPKNFLKNVDTPYDKASKKLVRQCFAIMASRISLDDCSHTVEGAELIKHSILSHLRLVKQFDPGTGTALSLSPSEPLVAQAVAGLLYQERIWEHVVSLVASKLFYPGLVTKGAKGEFYVLLILILARDLVVQPKWNITPTPVATSSKPEPLGDSYTVSAAGAFELKHLLQKLLTPELFKVIWNAKKAGSGSSTTMGDAFKDAKLNFSHFTTASGHLYGNKEATARTSHGEVITIQRELLGMNEYLQLMLYRQAGLSMAVNQPEWDAALASYFGDESTPVDPKKLSSVLIQTKNLNVKAGARESQPSFSHFPGIADDVPILGLTFNIGYEGEPCIQQIPHDQNNVWYFDIRGSGSRVFSCLSHTDGLGEACKDLLEILIPDPQLTQRQRDIMDTCEPFSRITFAGQAGGVESEARRS